MLGNEVMQVVSYCTKLFIFVLGLFLLSSLSPAISSAAPYGSGTYGSGTYGAGGAAATPTPAPGPGSTVSSVVSSVGSAISTFFCTNQAPSSAPNLYQINTTATTATLYFAPAGSPYDSYFVSFGNGVNDQGNGAEFPYSQAKGAISYTASYLAPNTIYTFKVRGGNGCKPGDWSSTLTIKTQPKNSKAIARFYPKQQAKVAQAAPKRSVLGLWNRAFPRATPTPNVKMKPKTNSQR